MSTTNFTETLQLPQCIATDKVNWLEDFNDLGAKVDAFAKETKTQLANLETADSTTSNTLESMQAILEEQSSLNQKNTTDIAGLKESVDLQTTHNNEQDEEINLLKAQDSALEADINTKAKQSDVDNLNASVTLLNQKTTALENITGSTSINAPTLISHAGDLNTIIKTGFYYSPGNNQISNMPVVTTPTTSFTLNVYRAATGGIIQHFICGSQKSGTQYIRYVNTSGDNPTFGEWKEVVSRDVLTKVLEEEGYSLSINKNSQNIITGISGNTEILTGTKYIIWKYASFKNLLLLSGQLNLTFTALGTSGLNVVITKPITDFIPNSELVSTDIVYAPLTAICDYKANTVGYVSTSKNNLIFNINCANMPQSHKNVEQKITFAINLLLKSN